MRMGSVLAFAFGAAPGLLGAHASQRNGIDRLQMAGIADQVNLHALAVEVAKAGGALVIFHIAAAEDGARIDIFKARVYVGCGAAHGVVNGGEASAMAHGHDAFLGAVHRGSGENLLHHGNQGGVAFQRKALGANVERLQHLLEDVGFHQLLQNGFAIDLGLRTFQTVDDPLTAFGIGNVHELSADACHSRFRGRARRPGR